MIAGTVTSELEAVIPLTVLNASGKQHGCDAVLDTGFNGYLTLPPQWILDLDLLWLTREAAILGDGSTHWFDAYEGQVFME